MRTNWPRPSRWRGRKPCKARSSSTPLIAAASIRARFWPLPGSNSLALRRSEDAYVEELFGFVTSLGAPLLHAHFPRAYLDVNREPYELDPVLFRDGLPHYANTQSVRVVGGLGTIARIVSESDEIYREPLIGRRRARAYQPPLHPLPRDAEGSADRGAEGVRPRRAHRLPFDAVESDRRPGLAGGRTSCSATASAPPVAAS